MTTQIASIQDHSRSVTTQSMVFDPDTVSSMQRMAEIMSSARVTIPKHLAGSPGDCLAVVMQAAQWRMNPFAVAQKTHLVNGQLGYEAQLVNAVLSSSSLLASRLNYEWEGEWKNVNGKSDKDSSRAVVVSAILRGETQPRILRLDMSQVGGARNSPLWETDPRQQLAYLAIKRWARLHAPDVMLGVYTVDELRDAIDVTPEPTHESTSAADRLAARIKEKRKTEEPPPPPPDVNPETGEVVDPIADLLLAIGECATLDDLDQYRPAIMGLKLGDHKELYRRAADAWKARQTALKASA